MVEYPGCPKPGAKGGIHEELLFPAGSRVCRKQQAGNRSKSAAPREHGLLVDDLERAALTSDPANAFTQLDDPVKLLKCAFSQNMLLGIRNSNENEHGGTSCYIRAPLAGTTLFTGLSRRLRRKYKPRRGTDTVAEHEQRFSYCMFIPIKSAVHGAERLSACGETRSENISRPARSPATR